MSYLVTGGTGFIGSWVVKSIVESGNKVVCFELDPNISRMKMLLGEKMGEVSIVNGDVLQINKIIEVIKKYNVTHVAHIAAAVLNICKTNPPYAMQVNVNGFTNILEACRLSDIRRLVWASSASVFGGSFANEKIPNNAAFKPTSIYAGSKLLGENLAEHYHYNYGLDVIGLRYTFVTGHGMPNSIGGKFIEELCEKPALGKKGRVPWGDDNPDWLWAGDAGKATMLALTVNKTKTRAFNVAGNSGSVKSAIEYIKNILPGSDIEPLSGKMGFNNFDGTVAEQEIGYKPEWTMEMQLKEHVNRARRNAGLSLIC
tara:strand:- start:8 stop:949 length:942 start_codon:yes stop_codon:yes gene_type:complete